jgi:hypothetical protein
LTEGQDFQLPGDAGYLNVSFKKRLHKVKILFVSSVCLNTLFPSTVHLASGHSLCRQKALR